MKKIFLSLILSLSFVGYMAAQGLEGIDVEVVYVTDANDAADQSGDYQVAVGAKVYRVYADMAPGYGFIQLFGQNEPQTNKLDFLRIESTDVIFNNTDRGGPFATDIGDNRLDENTVMIDSYITCGNTSDGTVGVDKSEDTDGAIANGDGLLQNNDPLAGTPLNQLDGSIPGAATPFILPPGQDQLVEDVFGEAAVNGLVSDVLSMAQTTPVVGPTAANRVLIMQVTTAGDFSFNLNVAIRNLSTNDAEVYVWDTPQPDQMTHPELVYPQVNQAPTVALTSPTSGQVYNEGDGDITFEATANDVDGTVTQVEFFFGMTSIGVDTDGNDGWSIQYTPTAMGPFMAVATDDDGETGMSNPISITYNGNLPPIVDLDPIPTVITGDQVTFTATASDDVAIANVEFFVDGVSVGIDTDGTDGYSATYTTLTAGTFTVEAVATDAGSTTTKTASDTEPMTVVDNVLPVVSITNPIDGTTYNDGDMFNVEANATDADGSVASVEFFANGTSIGVDTDGNDGFSIAYTTDFATTGEDVIFTAIATDDRGATGNAAPVQIQVLDPSGSAYELADVTQPCNFPTVCMPFRAIKAVDDIIGYDMVIGFDANKVFPIGITKLDSLLDSGLFDVDFAIDTANSEMLISVFLNSTAPIGTYFSWNGGLDGDLLCIEFAKQAGYNFVDMTDIQVLSLQESYVNGVVPILANIGTGTFESNRIEEFEGNVVFWRASTPIRYFPGVHLLTEVYGNDAACGNKSATAVELDTNGFFTHDLNNGLSVSIERDIDNTTDVQPVINGADALLVRRLLLNRLQTINIWRIMSMDVNMDGVISAGDASQINQRAVLQIGEYRQAWSHDVQGNKTVTEPTKDWLFIDRTTVNTQPEYLISGTFPSDDGVGFSKNRVPVLPFCNPAPVTDWATCPDVGTEEYVGILLGDANGSYITLPASATLRASDKVIVDLGASIEGETYTEVPVTFEFADEANTIDLALNFDETVMTFNSVVSSLSSLQIEAFYNEVDQTLRITSNSLETLNPQEDVFMIRFDNLTDRAISPEYITDSRGYINGEEVAVSIEDRSSSTEEIAIEGFELFPNPTTGFINVRVANEAIVDVINMQGKQVVASQKIAADQLNEINLSTLANGLYTVRVQDENGVRTERVVVAK